MSWPSTRCSLPCAAGPRESDERRLVLLNVPRLVGRQAVVRLDAQAVAINRDVESGSFEVAQHGDRRLVVVGERRSGATARAMQF